MAKGYALSPSRGQRPHSIGFSLASRFFWCRINKLYPHPHTSHRSSKSPKDAPVDEPLPARPRNRLPLQDQRNRNISSALLRMVRFLEEGLLKVEERHLSASATSRRFGICLLEILMILTFEARLSRGQGFLRHFGGVHLDQTNMKSSKGSPPNQFLKKTSFSFPTDSRSLGPNQKGG